MTKEFGANLPLNETYEQPIRDEVAGAVGETAVAAADIRIGGIVESPVNMYPYTEQARAAAAQREKEAATARQIESIKILDKDAFKLGDLNPLIHPTDLRRKESVDAVRYTIQEKIHEYGGLMPNVLESAVVSDGKNADLRFIARFEVPTLSEEQIMMLEELVRETYGGMSVRTRTDSKDEDVPSESYPPTQPSEEMRSQTAGWYMGPAPVPTSPLYQGLYVFQDLGQIGKKNFTQSLEERGKSVKYIVEIREASQYQTDLVTFVTQVATVLGKEELPKRGQLLYETYYDLIRLGLKEVDKGAAYGMDDAMDMIRRELLIPLASPDISGSIKEDPQSVLLVGVPGTGKTLIAEQILQQETGLFILPIDPFELQKEVALPKEKQRLMPRIAEIARITGKRVILHVDDIENMVGADAVTNSTMLNLMAGVQESGFYIIASTNYPEKINKSLIQPQRFSVLIHCGLQDKDARYEILKIHANLTSKNHNIPLFKSEEARDIILQEVARLTDGFTPRYLANIATIAKSHLVARVAEAEGRTMNLTEESLQNHKFEVEDWAKAFAEVDEKYDSASVKAKDQQLRDFVKKHMRLDIGFASNGKNPSRKFSQAVISRVKALEEQPE